MNQELFFKILEVIIIIVGIVIAFYKINEKQNLTLKGLRSYNDRQDDRIGVLEKDNEKIYGHINQTNIALNNIEKNSLKHLERDMNEMKVNHAREFTEMKTKMDILLDLKNKNRL